VNRNAFNRSSCLGLILIVATALAGCETNLKKIAAQASVELNIRIDVVAPRNDFCQIKQLNRLITEFRIIDSPRQKEVFRTALQKYSRIRLHPTKHARTIDGGITNLRLWRYRDEDFRGETFKDLNEPVVVTGEAPRTVLTKGDLLIVETQVSGRINGHRRDFYTRDPDLYEAITSVDHAAIAAFASPETGETPSIWKNDSEITADCGVLVKLADLL